MGGPPLRGHLLRLEQTLAWASDKRGIIYEASSQKREAVNP
jgi:hypothetical protein